MRSSVLLELYCGVGERKSNIAILILTFYADSFFGRPNVHYADSGCHWTNFYQYTTCNNNTYMGQIQKQHIYHNEDMLTKPKSGRQADYNSTNSRDTSAKAA